MAYELVTMQEKVVAGIAAQTANSDPGMMQKIGALWKEFYSGTAQGMAARVNQKAIALYCDYGAQGADGGYTVLVGAEVSAAGANPSLSHRTVPAGTYARFSVHGDMVQAVGAAWQEIWRTPLERTFTGDFEEYQDDFDGSTCTVHVYVAVKG